MTKILTEIECKKCETKLSFDKMQDEFHCNSCNQNFSRRVIEAIEGGNK
jgi:hypothetical protein